MQLDAGTGVGRVESSLRPTEVHVAAPASCPTRPEYNPGPSMKGAALPIAPILIGLMLAGRLPHAVAEESVAGLVGHWPLDGDSKDRSGRGNHGVAHGESAMRGEFDGRAAFVEVPASPSLSLGTGDFTACAWVWTAPDVEDV